MCNPDGCGFVSSSGLSYRGLSFKTFLKEISKVRLDEECIIHFRYATHGSIKRANCHPFDHNGLWFAHNGILSVTPRGDMTDSETAFLDILSPVADRYGVDSPQMRTAVGCVIGYSKFAFMKDGKVTMFGNFERHNGRYYSNIRHFAFMRQSPKATSKSISWEDYLNLRYSTR